MSESDNSEQVVVVGGGQAALTTIATLRQKKYPGTITLISDEPVLPYQRPPLSKSYMKGELAAERLFLKPENWFADQQIELRLGERATSIDRGGRSVVLESGDSVAYDRLVLATGAAPRKLAIDGSELEGVYYLRAIADVDDIRPDIESARRVAIIGAGYIGLEAAAVFRQIGLDVDVFEYAPRVMERVTTPMMSAFFTDLHTKHGVNIHTDARISRLDDNDGSISAVVLEDGSRFAADVVLIGVGAAPCDRLAREAGLNCDDGILVDDRAQTSDPSIFAAGDCTRRPLLHSTASGRLESVHNAIEQGKQAAMAILGEEQKVLDCPWFWSDQFDVKLQIAGLSGDHDETVVRGTPEAGAFAVFYLRASTLIATDAVNSPKEFALSKRLIMNRQTVDRDKLADPDVPLTEC